MCEAVYFLTVRAMGIQPVSEVHRDPRKLTGTKQERREHLSAGMKFIFFNSLRNLQK